MSRSDIRGSRSGAGPRFAWLNAVTGQRLPEDVLEDPERAWNAAASALGVDMPELTRLVAARFSVTVADLSREIPQDHRIIPLELAHAGLVVPYRQQARTVHVATCDPGNMDLVQKVEFATGRDAVLEVAPPEAILEALAVLGDSAVVLDAEWSSLESDGALVEAEEDDPQMGLSAENSAILDLLIKHAIELGASDVHVQAAGQGATVRYRVDGVLQAGPNLSLQGMASVLGRAKAVGGMDPAVRIRPQDGRGSIRVNGVGYDLRFSTLPSSGSESLVIRVLAQGGTLSFESYGADPDSMERLRQGFLDQTAGVFVVTGPTGSGKTTLLYSLLGELNDGRRHIHTVEDPVEIQLEGLAQVQVNRKAGLTFEGALRSLLRQDPDVILVSETRDAETAKACTDAAMTGHLVATTLHTIDATTALLRLRDLGVDPREMAQVLTGISAQRLLRTLCTECREPVTRAEDPLEEWFLELVGELPAYRSVGCRHCRGTGYSGRFPAVEVMLATEELVDGFISGLPHHDLRRIAQRAGMRTMGQIAVARAVRGDTDVAEIRRVMGSDLITPETVLAPDAAAKAPSHTELSAPRGMPRDPDAALMAADVLLISSDPRTRVIVEDGVHRVGLTMHVEPELPAAAVWTEINGPEIVIMDLQNEGDGAARMLGTARDAFSHLLPRITVAVLTPPDDLGLERILLEHAVPDYLRAPLTPEQVGFLVAQMLRRVEILGRPDH